MAPPAGTRRACGQAMRACYADRCRHACDALLMLMPTRVFLLACAVLCAGCVAQPRPAPTPPAQAAPAAAAARAASVMPTAVAGVVPAVAPDVQDFVAQLLRQHPDLERTHIEQLLAEARVQPSIIAAMQRPAEAKPWKDYRPIFLGQARIDAGIAFYRAHRERVDRIADRYGVPPQILVAILGVETYYGRQTGGYRVLDALYTLAFHYPPRAAFFQKELAVFLSLPRNALPGPRAELRGSYAGAMGWCQFMPSSFARYGVSVDAGGPVDLWSSLPDILASTANYLAQHGWQRDAPIAVRAQIAADAQPVPIEGSAPIHTVAGLAARGYTGAAGIAQRTPATLLTLQGRDGPEYWITFTNFQVITRYNTSAMYALAVTQLAADIAQGAATQ